MLFFLLHLSFIFVLHTGSTRSNSPSPSHNSSDMDILSCFSLGMLFFSLSLSLCTVSIHHFTESEEHQQPVIILPPKEEEQLFGCEEPTTNIGMFGFSPPQCNIDSSSTESEEQQHVIILPPKEEQQSLDCEEPTTNHITPIAIGVFLLLFFFACICVCSDYDFHKPRLEGEMLLLFEETPWTQERQRSPIECITAATAENGGEATTMGVFVLRLCVCCCCLVYQIVMKMWKRL